MFNRDCILGISFISGITLRGCGLYFGILLRNGLNLVIIPSGFEQVGRWIYDSGNILYERAELGYYHPIINK